MKAYLILLSVLVSGCNQGSSNQGSGGAATTPAYKLNIDYSCPIETHNPNPRLVVFGDSLAYQSWGYATQFASLIGLPMANYAAPSTAFETQITSILCAEINDYDVVVFQPGVNDAIQHRLDQGYLNAYRELWQMALHRLISSNARVLLGTTTRARVDLVSQLPDGVTNAYGQILKEELSKVEAPNVCLVDSYAVFDSSVTHMYDWVHPNAEGAALIAEAYLNAYSSY